MATQPKNPNSSVARQSSELANASAQVVAHRMTRMALAGPLPSARDRKEFKRMVDEKHLAFGESWLAMIGHATLSQVALGSTAWRSLCYPWLGGGATPAVMASQIQLASIAMIQKGLEPMHRKAVANAKRLAKTPLR